jgi:uncharacterized lipoprotein YbaY
MTLYLTVNSSEPLPPGTPLRVEIRDTSQADAAAVIVASQTTRVPASGDAITVSIALERVPDGSTVWAHADLDGDGRVSAGDFITMESYPVKRSGSEQRTTITIRKVS